MSFVVKPVYQGQIDVFCAPYAVINALRHIHGIRLLSCRQIFHEALLEMAEKPEEFQAALYQQTDYADWVDRMLAKQQAEGTLEVRRPFASGAGVSPEVLWGELEAWLCGRDNRAVLLQFVRYLLPEAWFSGTPPETALIRHWTCGIRCEGGELVLFDSCAESGALHCIDKRRVVTEERLTPERDVCIIPHTVRLVSESARCVRRKRKREHESTQG